MAKHTFLQKLKSKFNYTLAIVLKIASVIGMIYLLRYLGFKGFLGIVIGISVTVYLFLSKNEMLLWVTGLDKNKNSQWYLNEIKK